MVGILRPVCTVSPAAMSAAACPTAGAWGPGRAGEGATGGGGGGGVVVGGGGGASPAAAAAASAAADASAAAAAPPQQRRSLASAAHAQQAEYDAELLAEDAGLGLMGGGADLAPAAPSSAAFASSQPPQLSSSSSAFLWGSQAAAAEAAAAAATVRHNDHHHDDDAAVRAVLERLKAFGSSTSPSTGRQQRQRQQRRPATETTTHDRLAALAREVARADVAMADPALAPPGLAAELERHERQRLRQQHQAGQPARRRRSTTASADPAAASTATTHAAAADGEVRAPAGSLYGAMVEHYLALREASPQYTSRVPFGEFARRYVDQLKLEERSRARAAEDLERALLRDAASGKPGAGAGGRRGHATASLISTWQPLLAQAIAQEQAEVELAATGGGGGANGGSAGGANASAAAAAAAKRDRANYGPYLLVLDPEELATITIQCVLNRIAASVHTGADEVEEAASVAATGALDAPDAAAAGLNHDDHARAPSLLRAPSLSAAGTGARPPGMGGMGGGGGIVFEAMSAPAVALAEMVGRAANERVMLVHRNARLREAASARRRERAEAEDAGAGGLALSSSSTTTTTVAADDPASLWAQRASAALEAEAEAAGLVLPPDVAQSVDEMHAEAERRHAALEAARGKLRAVAADPRAPHGYRLSASEAARSVRWDADARIKVGAALVALLVENAPVPAALHHDHALGAAAAAAAEEEQADAWLSAAGGAEADGSSITAAAAANDDATAGWRWDEDGLGAAASSASSPSAQATNNHATPASLAPAFDYSYVRLGLKRQAFVRATPALVDALARDRGALAALAAKAPPMLIPPRPWASHNVGGYLTSSHWMMRTRWSWHVKQALREGSARNQFPAVLDALNALGATAWRVNAPVYECLRSLWRERRTDAGLPRQDPFPMPAPPTTAFRLAYDSGRLLALGGPPTPLEQRTHRLAADDARRLNRNAASLRADFEIKLRVAEDVASRPEVFYPHTLDFRGRAYPIHAALQHLGDDVSRGLLCFAEPKPLGPEGLSWLYVHLANVWGHGVDKLSFDARRAFVREHLSQVLASARDPLGKEDEGGAGGAWWTRAEKPWQALAACVEVAAALAHPEGPAHFGSRLPVHMDGSCNGLQHYAALGRDEAGGRAVNLLPCDAPQDVYSGVARLVAERVAADAAAASGGGGAGGGGEGSGSTAAAAALFAASSSSSSASSSFSAPAGAARALSSSALADDAFEEHEPPSPPSSSSSSPYRRPPTPAEAAVAARLVGQVDRKLVKQTVMTSVYGVTAVGAREQVEARLRERGWAAGDPHRRELLFRASRYVASLTLDALAEMFGNARRIMAWLAECARLVAEQGEPVRWRNPLGLPVAQPYHRSGPAPVHTLTQAFSVQREDGDRDAAVARQRQRTAFPPNYIHSVDSAHMMRTALACAKEGVTFAGVHDSFWTHAGDVGAMAALLRDEFASLHGGGGGGEGGESGGNGNASAGRDLLADLRAQLVEAHPGVDFPPVPARGDLDVDAVRQSRYFFS
jgi:DNA-directed RNA polymerase